MDSEVVKILMAAAATFGSAAISESAKKTISAAWDRLKSAVSKDPSDAKNGGQLLELAQQGHREAADSFSQLGLLRTPEVSAALAALELAVHTHSSGVIHSGQVHIGTVTQGGIGVNHGPVTLNFGNSSYPKSE